MRTHARTHTYNAQILLTRRHMCLLSVDTKKASDIKKTDGAKEMKNYIISSFSKDDEKTAVMSRNASASVARVLLNLSSESDDESHLVSARKKDRKGPNKGQREKQSSPLSSSSQDSDDSEEPSISKVERKTPTSSHQGHTKVTTTNHKKKISTQKTR